MVKATPKNRNSSRILGPVRSGGTGYGEGAVGKMGGGGKQKVECRYRKLGNRAAGGRSIDGQ